MKVLCCGDRDWNNKEFIRNLFIICENIIKKKLIIIHGAARGADTLCGEVAKELGFEVRKYPAKWEELGKKAGPIRNQEMLDKENPDMVFAFHNDIERSKGTKDMVKRAQKRNIRVHMFCEGNE
jgi:hypothetical protein